VRNSTDSDDDDSDTNIKPAEKTEPTAHASMTVTDFFGKKPAEASSKVTTATARKASGRTSKVPPKKATAMKMRRRAAATKSHWTHPSRVGASTGSSSEGGIHRATGRVTTTDHIII
jgi:hypothetical protein